MDKTGHVVVSSSSPRILGYTRLSKSESNGLTRQGTLERHIDELKSYGCTEIYWDIISRSTKKRVGLSKLIDEIKSKSVSEVVLTRLDRLTDSHSLMEEFIELVINTNTPCKGLKDNIDLTTVGGRTHARLLVTFSRNEIERTKERYLDSWEYVRKNHKISVPVFGYILENGYPKLNTTPFLCLLETKEELSISNIARELIELYISLKSLRITLKTIMSKYGFFPPVSQSLRSVNNNLCFNIRTSYGLNAWLYSPILRGHTSYFRRDLKKREPLIFYNTHPDHILMTEHEYQQILTISQMNKQIKGYGSPSRVHLFTGLAKCSECNRNMHTSSSKNKKGYVYIYYMCNGFYANCICPNKSIIRDINLESLVNSELKKRAFEISLLIKEEDSNPKSLNPLIPPILDKIKILESLQDPELLPNIRKLYNKIEHINNEANSLSQSLTCKRQLLLDCFQDDLFLESRTNQEKRDIYLLLVDTITVNSKKEVTVKLKV